MAFLILAHVIARARGNRGNPVNKKLLGAMEQTDYVMAIVFIKHLWLSTGM